MEIDLDALVEVFGEPNISRSHPDRGDYWFEYGRPDGVSVRLVLGVFDHKVSIGIDYGATAGTSLLVEKCDRVRVLEAERRTLEVISAEYSMRCFLSLDGASIMTVNVPGTLT